MPGRCEPKQQMLQFAGTVQAARERMMEYKFFDRADEELIKTSELQTERGIAVALRTTGYDLERSEVVELAIVDFDGNELFSQCAKPQNTEEWIPSDASGGLSFSDVADASELYQFEDEIIELFENAELVVCQHRAFMEGAIEASWVSLPAFECVDVVSMFCESHCTADYLGEPAPTAALPGIAHYYGLAAADGTLAGEAKLIVACYRAIVAEHVEQREAKGADYWERYDKSKEGERAQEARAQANARMREHRLNQMNGLLWIAGAIIFVSLAIQLSQRGGDMGMIILSGAFAAFALFRGIVNFRK